MKPFNLEKALAGDPVVTREGRKILEIKKFNCNSNPIVAIVDGIDEPVIFNINGSSSYEYNDNYDLFMNYKEIK